jgi:hypothetical protein
MRLLLRIIAYAAIGAVVSGVFVAVVAALTSSLNLAVFHVGAMLLPLGGVYVATTAERSPQQLTRAVRLVAAAIAGVAAAIATFASYVIVLLVWGLDRVPEVAIGNAPPGPAMPMLWTLLALVGGAWVTNGMLRDRSSAE